MTKLTFYGALGRIGGNKILLEDKKGNKTTRLWLDFGKDFVQFNKYFSEFAQPQKCRGITDFIKTNQLPKLPGLYRPDFVQKSGHKVKKVSYDGVLLSHAHFDHASEISHIHPQIPIYSTLETKVILQALQESGTYQYGDFVVFREYYSRSRKNREVVERPFEIFKPGEVKKIGGLKVESWPVDHSLPGACGYIIHTSSGPLVYTGDFRFHGHKSDSTERFFERAQEVKPKLMLCEGTNIDERPGRTEAQVGDEVSEAIKSTKGMVLADFPVRDLDRLNSFYTAAVKNNRKLAINLKQAYLLKLMWESGCNASPALNMEAKDFMEAFRPGLVVFAPKKKMGNITEHDVSLEEKLKDYSGWEREFIAHDVGTKGKPKMLENAFCVHANHIRNNQEQYVVAISPFSIQGLNDLKPKKDSLYIYSKVEPFNDEMKMDYQGLKSWLDLYGLREVHIHCSGHAFGEQIGSAIARVNPGILIPIHTEHPELFEARIKEADKGYKGRVEVLGFDSEKNMNGRARVVFEV
ncbi:MAG: MBL fold metallo-hydrolase [Candidatus Woesearchaeota archaeon]